MGTWICHLRLADVLLASLPQIDGTAFCFGNLVPDSGIPNADWTAFDPPKHVTHFLRDGEGEGRIRDLAFYREYVLPLQQEPHSERYGFLLGYFCHLLCDNLWSRRIVTATQQAFTAQFAGDRQAMWQDTAGKLIMSALLSNSPHSPTGWLRFFAEKGCGDLACWFSTHETQFFDVKEPKKRRLLPSIGLPAVSWQAVKGDWYDLDHRYVRDHSDRVFWRVILPAPSPPMFMPLVSTAVLHQQFDYIRHFYSQPGPERQLDRGYPFLNEQAMVRFVAESAVDVLAIMGHVAARSQHEQAETSLLWLDPARLAPFPLPLGDE